ncbi:MAG: C40 family peptidase [Gemmatimonadales bacterium]|nr:C40 family peptidase [Gemmatimonadales bacterium]
MASAVTRAAVAPVVAAPTVRAEQVTQLVLGETAEILEAAGEWRRVRTVLDRYEGWTNAGYLLEVDDDAAAWWRGRAGAWCEGAVLTIDAARVSLPLRARVAVEGASVVLPDDRRGALVEGAARLRATVAQDALATPPERWAATHFLGAPYQWGGVTPWGVDCSGLVQTVFAARGRQLPRDSGEQAKEGDPVDLDRVAPGDLLFFANDAGRINHVAFAGQEDTLVHSTIACGGMLVESWAPGSRAAGLRARLVAARRLESR